MDDESCVICTDPISKDDWGKLECKHIFHFKCIQKWLEYKSCCPLCRKETNEIINIKNEVVVVEKKSEEILRDEELIAVFSQVESRLMNMFNSLPDYTTGNNQNCFVFIRRGGITHFRQCSVEQNSGYQSLNERTGRRIIPDPTQYTQSLNGMTRKMRYPRSEEFPVFYINPTLHDQIRTGNPVVNESEDGHQEVDLLHEHQEVIGTCRLHRNQNDPNVIRVTTKLHPVFCNGEIFSANFEHGVDNVENNRTIERKKKKHIDRKKDFRERREKSKKFRRNNNTRRKYFNKHRKRHFQF